MGTCKNQQDVISVCQHFEAMVGLFTFIGEGPRWLSAMVGKRRGCRTVLNSTVELQYVTKVDECVL